MKSMEASPMTHEGPSPGPGDKQAAVTRRWRRPLALALLLMAVLAVTAILLFPGRPSVKVVDAKIERLDFEKLDVVFLLDVKNPMRLPIRVRDVEYDLTAMGQTIASGNVGAGIDIAAGQTGGVRLPVRIEHDKLLPLLKGLGQQEAVPFDLTVRGRVDAGVSIPVTYVHRGYVYPSHAPRYELKKIRVSKTKGLTVEVVLAVTNPNNVDLKIEEVRGAVKLGTETMIELEHTLSVLLPAGRTVDVVIPVRIDVSKVADAFLTEGKRMRFSGKFKLGEPATWRKMLLGNRD
jgi:LEA14-like dessication related protein